MGIPKGFKYKLNLSNYMTKDQKAQFIEEYGKDLENHYDTIEKQTYPIRIFCLDCIIFDLCQGKGWDECPERKRALKIINERG